MVSCHYKKPYAATHSTASPKLNTFFETMNRSNLAYIAGKSLCPSHAAAAFANLLLHSCSTFYHYRSFGGVLSLVRANISGFARGLRHRQPVSKEISRLYKENLADFANPLRLLLRRPGRQRFWSERPQYYPAAQASLELRAER